MGVSGKFENAYSWPKTEGTQGVRLWFYTCNENYRWFFTTEAAAKKAHDAAPSPNTAVMKIEFTKRKLADYLNQFAA